MTIGAVGNYRRITERPIYRLMRVRRIPIFQVGGSWKLSTVAIDERMKRQFHADVKEA